MLSGDAHGLISPILRSSSGVPHTSLHDGNTLSQLGGGSLIIDYVNTMETNAVLYVPKMNRLGSLAQINVAVDT